MGPGNGRLPRVNRPWPGRSQADDAEPAVSAAGCQVAPDMGVLPPRLPWSSQNACGRVGIRPPEAKLPATLPAQPAAGDVIGLRLAVRPVRRPSSAQSGPAAIDEQGPDHRRRAQAAPARPGGRDGWRDRAADSAGRVRLGSGRLDRGPSPPPAGAPARPRAGVINRRQHGGARQLSAPTSASSPALRARHGLAVARAIVGALSVRSASTTDGGPAAPGDGLCQARSGRIDPRPGSRTLRLPAAPVRERLARTSDRVGGRSRSAPSLRKASSATWSRRT